MENYYNCKASVPELFQNRDIWSQEIQSALKNQYFIFLPVTSDNKMLIFHSVKNRDPRTYDYDLASKVYFMLFGKSINLMKMFIWSKKISFQKPTIIIMDRSRMQLFYLI